MNSYAIPFHNIDKSSLKLVGGKGANLGELCRIGGITVPDGFCISTEAYYEAIGASINPLLDQLSLLNADDRYKIGELGAKIRTAIEAITIPGDIVEEIKQLLSQFGENEAYAVRSSATAEDLPTASFAGQQDTYLNIIGKEAILLHISKCWASLFTDRAVTYRIQHGFDHRKVQLAVVVQKMVFPQASGILFTADPVSSNRKVISIDASYGLGEALVSGLVNADIYKVHNGKIADKKISTKKIAIYGLRGGGTKKQEIEAGQQNSQALSDEQILQLERIGRKIEEHFGKPQDIEWCLADDKFYIVQSRPITTLFPLPVEKDNQNHVYVSVGHQQMMTDAMKPLGLSFYLLTTPAPMRTAGGRLFVDIAGMLASPDGRRKLIDTLGNSDPLLKSAMLNIVGREDFFKPSTDDKKEETHKLPDFDTLKDYDPGIVDELISRRQKEVEELKQNIQTKSGTGLFDFIVAEIQKLRGQSHPQSFGVIMTGMNAAHWINGKMKEWLGEKNVADTLTQSVPNNITSEMGLALLDLADVIRPYPEVIKFLEGVKDQNFLDELPRLYGGKEVRDAFNAFLGKFGMRCAGEIDITRTRWSEKPAILVPMILNNIRNFEPGAAKRKFGQGLQEALQKEKELLEKLKQLPDGEQKARETKRMIDLVRNFAGYREYPKYDIVTRYFVFKQALLKEAAKLPLGDKEDIFYLSFEELREAVRSNKTDHQLISKRKEEFKSYQKLSPPRLFTSDGEIISGRYNREDIPAGAIVGLAVSSGVIEGRARVISNLENADMEEGDILVTPFTDPSWTPLFVSIKGLVTEVGGLMTHGAVIAREYGLPAVVGVENATKLIKDGQRIRVHGTEGYIEIL
jgi:pyruvate,water dikinase